MLDKLSSKESKEKMDAMVSRMERIPIHIRKTMTFDNGTENTIGLVREYLPKGMDLTNVTQQELMVIGTAINERPRKRLGYKTPNEVLLQEAGWCVTS